MTRRILRYLTGTAIVLGAIFALLAVIVLTASPAETGGAATRTLLLVVGGTALAVSLGAVWLVARLLSRPIETLTGALRRVAGGDFDAPPLTTGRDGPEELVRAFDQMRQQLKASVITRDYLDRLLSSMRDAIVVADPDDKIVRVNAAAASLLGYSDNDLIGEPLSTVVDGDLAEPEDDGSSAKPVDGVFRHRDGSPITVSYTVSEVRNDRGELEGRIVAAQNVAERRRIEQRIRYLARTDSLTKMANRMQFQHQLQQAIARAKRTNQYLALLYMDIDRFKDINDTFGH
ncbi:MAG TPA: diguanylate cyclase, partial [Gammaproteobacteria bacterium]